MGFFKTSKPHESKSTPSQHTDTERYNNRGQKDKAWGKLKVSGEKHTPSLRDIWPFKKKS